MALEIFKFPLSALEYVDLIVVNVEDSKSKRLTCFESISISFLIFFLFFPTLF